MKLISLISTTLTPELNLVCRPTDAILLRQDAVYLCLCNDITWPTNQLFVLEQDISVRQLTPTTIFTIIDNERWVDLCASAEQNLLWQN